MSRASVVLDALVFPWGPRAAVARHTHLLAWRILGVVLLVAALVPSECPVTKRLLAYVIFMTSVALSAEAIRRSSGFRRAVNRALQVAIALLAGFGMVCFRGVGELAAALALRSSAAVPSVPLWPVLAGAVLSGVMAMLWIASTAGQSRIARE